jgi:hypothetical protein
MYKRNTYRFEIAMHNAIVVEILQTRCAVAYLDVGTNQYEVSKYQVRGYQFMPVNRGIVLQIASDMTKVIEGRDQCWEVMANVIHAQEWQNISMFEFVPDTHFAVQTLDKLLDKSLAVSESPTSWYFKASTS